MNSHITFHTIREAAWLLGVSRAAVSRAIRTREVRATRCRSGLRVSSTELARLLGSRQAGGAA
jgi:excisionase family DNA binding protein